MILIPPPVYANVRQSPKVAIYADYSASSGFWKDNATVIPKSQETSASWAKEFLFEQLNQAAHDAKNYQMGWDGYGAPAPTDRSIALTVNILGRLKNSELSPFSVLPSADGGVGISFRGQNNRRAVLEILNDGTASYMLYGKGNPTWSSEFDTNGDLTAIFHQLSEYLS